MAHERWQKIERIFNEAVLLSGFEREHFVAAECLDDSMLYSEICGMLAEDKAADNLLDQTIFFYGIHLLGSGLENLSLNVDFAGYRLQRLIGRGGMGAVILAQDAQLERFVALKILTADVKDETAKRFQQEARAISAISHPNVAHVYEFGNFDGRYFMAMEYVPGKTLRELLGNGKLDEPSITEFSLQIVKSLVAAHNSGIIHRDIKPENVIVSNNRQVKVLDFGLAKFVAPLRTDSEEYAVAYPSGRTSLDTQPGVIIGTSAYMSPEQVRGKRVDSRTDLWSFGVMLFEMLTGKRPFAGDEASDVHAAILLKEYDAGDCPRSFRQIVGRLLQKNPDDRYQSAEDLLSDLNCLKTALDKRKNSLLAAEIFRKRKFLFVCVFFIIVIALMATGFKFFAEFSKIAAPRHAPVGLIVANPSVKENSGGDEVNSADGLPGTLSGRPFRLANS